jgi:ABC-type glycerol-3-phosphate transport system substrate-binding protein
MKKKIGLLLVILLLAFALVACGGGGDNANDNTGTGTGTEGELPLSTEVVGTPSDLGGDDGAEEMATAEP